MPRSVTPFLMFQEAAAENAMNFYVSLFARSEILEVERYGAGEQGAPGTIKKAVFAVAGQKFICIDSPVKHGFTFTPATSVFVECETEAELDETFRQLSAGGQVLMPLADYGFSTKFAWIADRFGVSWQLNLE